MTITQDTKSAAPLAWPKDSVRSLDASLAESSGGLQERATDTGLRSIRAAPLAGTLRAAQKALSCVRAAGSRGLFVALVVTPTLVTAIYYGLIASDRYVAEASFVVRSATTPASIGGLGTLLRMTGIGQSQDDSYAVQEFVVSRDAIRQLEERIPLRSMFSPDGADVIARFPPPLSGSSSEQLYLYYRRMVEVVVHPTTGISTLRVQAFSAQDAWRIARALLDLGEQVVNRMNERIQQDSVRFAEEGVRRAEARLVEVQLAMTAFRNRELMIDPAASSIVVAELVGRLSAELARTTAQIRELEAASPNSPQLPTLKRRVSALETQISQERERVSTRSDGLADKIAEYERLSFEREFSGRTLATAVTALEAARANARRQLLYLERIVEPSLADKAMMPLRLRNMLVTFVMALVAYMIIWLVWSGIQEHAHSAD